MSTNTAPFVVQPKLTAIAMAIKPTGMIADMVLPRVPVPAEKFQYTKFTTEEMFTIPETRVGRKSEPNQVEFGGTDVTDSTEDYGLDDFVPNKDLRSAQNTNYDPLAIATENTAVLVELSREQRVANLLFTLGTYASTLRTTLSGTSQWSDYTNSDPVDAILAAFDAMLVRPNIGIIGQAAWTKLRQHPKVIAKLLNTGGGGLGGTAAAGVATRRAIADLLELDELHVGSGFYNTAKPGQTASYARLWGKHAAFLRQERSVRNTQSALPTFGMTAQWGERVAGTIEDARRGLEGGRIVRVGEHVKELVAFQECGYFFQNVVA